MFETHPGYESDAESEIEESFVGNGEDYEEGCEGEKDDHQAVEVMGIRL
jgi:hypothetical protein